MKKYLTEFIGTFFLVFIICLAVARGTDIAWLAIGAGLMVMVYMGGPVSGAHYNPAVSIALWLSRKMPASDLLPYFGAQFAGAVAAGAAATWILGRAITPSPSPEVTAVQALTVESLFTFALCLVVLNVATAKKAAGNSYFGLAIGFTVAAAAFAGGPISGGAFNPAVGVGTILVSAVAAKGSLANLWLYIVGPCIGAIAASWAFRVQEADA
jgi:aquaporin Z